LIDPGVTVLLFTRYHNRDPFTLHGKVLPREVKDSIPVTVVWELQMTPTGEKTTVGRTAFDIPYLKNVAASQFYTKVKELVEGEMPLATGKTIECNVHKADENTMIGPAFLLASALPLLRCAIWEILAYTR
jgi:hypothetical protein